MNRYILCLYLIVPIDSTPMQKPVTSETIVIRLSDRHTDPTSPESRDSVQPENDNAPKKCCQSSNKLRIALVGLASTTIVAVVTLVIHFTKC